MQQQIWSAMSDLFLVYTCSFWNAFATSHRTDLFSRPSFLNLHFLSWVSSPSSQRTDDPSRPVSIVKIKTSSLLFHLLSFSNENGIFQVRTSFCKMQTAYFFSVKFECSVLYVVFTRAGWKFLCLFSFLRCLPLTLRTIAADPTCCAHLWWLSPNDCELRTSPSPLHIVVAPARLHQMTLRLVTTQKHK